MRLSPLAAVLFLATLSGAQAQGIVLKPCHADGVKEELRCGTLPVPENYDIKGGRVLKLEVVVVPAAKTATKPPVFYLSGGPGQAATTAARNVTQTSEVRKNRDIVLLDLRGTGKGTRLDCDAGGSDAHPEAYMEPLFHDGTAYAACAKKLSKTADLTQYTTVNAARDIEALRVALGYGKIDLYGGSYGTRQGIVFIHLFPKSVHAAIFSGLSPVSERGPLFHAQSAERAIEILFSQCAADAACHKAFPDPKADLDAVLATLGKQPAKVTLKHPVTGKPFIAALTASGFADSLRVMLYDEGMGRRVPLLLKKARAGDYGPFAEIALDHGRGMKLDLAIGLTLSVTCTEDVSRIRPEEVAAATKGSFIGDARVRGQMTACSVWPKGPMPKDYTTPFTSNVPVLLISGDLDPVTPPHFGVDAQKTFPNSVHVIVPGAHVSDSPCVDAMMKTFFDHADAKHLDTSCAATSKLPPFVLK